MHHQSIKLQAINLGLAGLKNVPTSGYRQFYQILYINSTYFDAA
jgi:hypothetical protein